MYLIERFAKKIIIYLSLILINPLILSVNALEGNLKIAKEVDELKNDFPVKQNLETYYILGPGDTLYINFLGLDFLNGPFLINPEGDIFLPEIGLFKVEGKTLNELNDLLSQEYEKYIYNPILEINIIGYRPLNIYLGGEVRQPGLYKLNIENNDINIFPKLYDALKLGRGFNNKADLTDVEIIRNYPESKGGGKIKTNINLISLIETGNQGLNIRVYDGDTIIIPKADKPLKDQILKINRSNISPEYITVFVTGNAISTGERTLKKGTSLTQAISSSGGKKLFTGDIEFIRFNYDGSTSKSEFPYTPNAKINTKNNPILMDGDLINIKRTKVGVANDFLREVTSPMLGIYGLYNILTGL